MTSPDDQSGTTTPTTPTTPHRQERRSDPVRAPRGSDFLALVRQRERGKLKVYIGAAAATGKTYRMLREDAVTARRPQVAIVDELAHTNVPGTRNGKRWQDVMLLLDEGANVITAVNVQHLESLNDARTRRDDP